MVLNVYRNPEQQTSIAWRPLSHQVEALYSETLVRREIAGDTPDKTVVRYRTENVHILDPANDDKWPEYVEARLEDPYKKGKMMGGFVFSKSLWAFIHEDSLDHIESAPRSFRAGSVIWKNVRIDDDVALGSFVELEQGVQVHSGATIGNDAVVRKGSILRAGSVLETGVRLGQFITVPENVVVGAMSQIGKRSTLQQGISIGRQSKVGSRSFISEGTTLEDSVSVGVKSFVGKNVLIGEQTIAGSHLHIGDGAIIGAESVLGSFVRVAKGVWLRSPTYAEDGAFISNNPSQQYVPSRSETYTVRLQYERDMLAQLEEAFAQ